VFVALPLALLAVQGWGYRWTSDDGFIYFRVVRQVEAGNGPVFNAGERVEAFTGVIWMALLLGGDLLTPIRLEWLAVVLGVAATVAGAAMAMAAAWRLWPAAPGELHLPFGVLAFAALTPVWVYATAGLETGLCFAWLGGCAWILARWATSSDRRLPTGQAVVLGLGWLVRPELALTSAAFLGLVVAGRRRIGRRGQVRTVAAFVALPVAYQVFRMGYFGTLTSSPAIAKEGTTMRWSRGWDYFRDTADAYRLWVPGLILLAGAVSLIAGRDATRRGQQGRLPVLVAGCFVATGIGQCLYVIAVGGDFGHARLLLHALFAICVPFAVVPLAARNGVALLMVPYAIVAATSMRPPQWTEGQFANGLVLPEAAGIVTLDDLGWGADGSLRASLEHTALHYQPGLVTFVVVGAETSPDVSLPAGVLGAIGAPSFAMGTEFHVIDLLGLADAVGARFDLVPGLAGHEKPYPASWLSARTFAGAGRPPPSAFPTEANPFVPTGADDEFWDEVEVSRRALGCGRIEELLDATSGPLTVGRFVDNLIGAVGRTTLRIPRDPNRAIEELCEP
jgi:arabinofuranosyltransferase